MIDIMTVEFAESQLKSLEEECRIRPNYSALANLASVYFTLNQPEKAAAIAFKIWERDKSQGIATNLAIILKDLGRHPESARIMEQAYWANPDDVYTRMGYGEALLRAGLWKQAWPIYDNARLTQQGAALMLQIPGSIPEWQGESLPEGHRLLVINEGGTGDRLSYARWLPELTKRGINWIFYPFDELYSLFERVFPADKLIKDDTEIDDPTFWCTTFSLPAKLGAVPTTIPEPLPFTATSEQIEKYKFNRTDNLPIVGICYEAAEKFQGGRRVRSLSEGQAFRLICQTADKVHWVSLQHGRKMAYPVTNIEFNTWEETAGLIHNLDAVVTVDTGTFWLASAMRKPTALLLSGNADWKFLTGRRCYWSPTVKIYRNETRGMENAVSELVMAIRNESAW